ncbi:hypothetical protein [Thermococcus sp.]|uniref:hypothetical protein n=1 Tax=Thermococcus sp. TaxID=35749 RepID=UPI002603DB37|nr:hypothetical protein [Thermococcus sp.]
MNAREIVELLDRRGEVSLDTWKALSVKRNGDGTVDILYRNIRVGTDEDPVFLWIYANVVDDGPEIRILERMTFRSGDIAWVLRYLPGGAKVYKGRAE